MSQLVCGVFTCGADYTPSPHLLGPQEEEVTLTAHPEWEHNDSRTSCGRCGFGFGLFRWKHHCRGCGVLLCHECSVFTELPSEFGYGQERQRICRWCVQIKFNILQAARAGHGQRVRVLINWGIDTSEPAASGSSALHAAAADKSQFGVEAVRCLTDQGFMEDGYDTKGLQPIHVAASVGNIDAIRILVHSGADLNETTRHEARSALQLAASHSHLQTAQYLVNTGARVEHKDCHGNTALLLAVVAGTVPLTAFLLNHGADLLAINHQGHDAHALNDLAMAGEIGQTAEPSLRTAMKQALSNRGLSSDSPGSLHNHGRTTPVGTCMGRASRNGQAPGSKHVKLGTPGGTFRESVYFDPDSSTTSPWCQLPESSPSSLSSYDSHLSLLRSSLYNCPSDLTWSPHFTLEPQPKAQTPSVPPPDSDDPNPIMVSHPTECQAGGLVSGEG
eukprot:TRINITY_DN6339_c0_g1_i5.p1 TRINITY_DN6339_c0_g1~~TRINITY_DN6339_c0_g1_i5.p1  ORF type:complete len:446 (+),score=49.88 TRINITY_DN6339_c0_g1_i5:316-1653(+)